VHGQCHAVHRGRVRGVAGGDPGTGAAAALLLARAGACTHSVSYVHSRSGAASGPLLPCPCLALLGAFMHSSVCGSRTRDTSGPPYATAVGTQRNAAVHSCVCVCACVRACVQASTHARNIALHAPMSALCGWVASSSTKWGCMHAS